MPTPNQVAPMVPDTLDRPTPAVRSILLYCASSYVAGRWNERTCSAWSAAEIAAACEAAERLCRPGGDAQLVLDGLRAVAEMLQVELPAAFGLDLLVEELVLLPTDLLEDAIRGVARTHTFRRFPTLAEFRQCIVEQIDERFRLARSVRALARDHRQRSGQAGRTGEVRTVGVQTRGGGLQPVARCLPQPAGARTSR